MRHRPFVLAAILAVAGCGSAAQAGQPSATVTVTVTSTANAASPGEDALAAASPTTSEGALAASRSHTFPDGRRVDVVDVVRTPTSAYPTDTVPPGMTVITVRVRYSQVRGGPTDNTFFAQLQSGPDRLDADQQTVYAGSQRWQSTDPSRLAVGDPYLHASTFAVPTGGLGTLALRVPSGSASTTLADSWTFSGVQVLLTSKRG